MASSTVAGLAGTLRGRVVERGDADYDEARALFNAMIDKRPAAIAYCLDEQDVASAIGFARERGLRVAVRGGGHNGGGLGSVDDGLVIDLSPMAEIAVDRAARMVHVQGGALLKDVDAATHAHGLAVPVGIIGTTGVGGLTLGGGMPTWKCGVHIYNADGAAALVGNDETAWAYRHAKWVQVIVGVDPDPANALALRDWTIGYSDELRPYTLGAGYVNMMMDDGQDRVRASYGDNYERLARVKATYDPENVFSVNQNIRPV